MGHEVHDLFGQKLLNTEHNVGECACKLPIVKWANILKVFKKSLKLNSASHNKASWYTDTDGFLGHSCSGEAGTIGPAFQQIIPFFGSPLICGNCLAHILVFSMYQFVHVVSS